MMITLLLLYVFVNIMFINDKKNKNEYHQNDCMLQSNFIFVKWKK